VKVTDDAGVHRPERSAAQGAGLTWDGKAGLLHSLSGLGARRLLAGVLCVWNGPFRPSGVGVVAQQLIGELAGRRTPPI